MSPAMVSGASWPIAPSTAEMAALRTSEDPAHEAG